MADSRRRISVVIDTNLLVRAAFNTHRYLLDRYRGSVVNIMVSRGDNEFRPMRLLDSLGHPLRQVISPALRQELLEALERLNPQDPLLIDCMKLVRARVELATVVEPNITVNCCRDPDDNRVLECAIGGQVRAIITGDEDLLSMREFEGIPIMNTEQFFSW